VVGAALSRFAVNKFDYNYAYKYMNYNYYSYGAETPKLESPTHGAKQPDRSKPSLVARLVDGIGSRVNSYIARARSLS
jgi:hypothetical protein